MDGADRVDDRTFRVNFSTEGLSKLRELLKDKLKEFLDDYIDETLVEYVIVLIKNGRHKDEARNELNVFLGDDTISFVSWLWDHLGSNLDLYVQPCDSQPAPENKAKPSAGSQAEKHQFNHIDSESGKGKSNRESRGRHNKEWKEIRGSANEAPLLVRSEDESTHKITITHEKVARHKRLPSPQPLPQKKRSRLCEERQKKEVASQAAAGAPRRLLQFAVRDAVATARPLSLTSEHSAKHIRSVVSAATEDSSLEVHPPRIRSVARVLNPMSAAIKAVEEASKDVTRVSSSRNVFDRLGCANTISDRANPRLELRESSIEDEEFRDFDQFHEDDHSIYSQKSNLSSRKDGNFTALESDTRIASDYASDDAAYDYEAYDDVNARNYGVPTISQTATSGGSRGDDSLMVQYSVARNAAGTKGKSWTGHDQPSTAPNPSSKIVNISVNVNTWKPSEHQSVRENVDMDNRKVVKENKAVSNKSSVTPTKDYGSPAIVGNGNAGVSTAVQRESPKPLPSNSGLYSNTRPAEDVDSRTIFVNNVHFAATKDSLSWHFNKFGEVLKVVMLTDTATGQPKGSAYVEFMRKEAAENALSLDGTSFMSRILKVVRKGAASQETITPLTRPRFAWGSPFTASRFARNPFPRGIPSMYRPRIPMKHGARSMQWTRDALSTSTENSSQVSSASFASPSVRSLTYVRPVSKVNGNTGAP